MALRLSSKYKPVPKPDKEPQTGQEALALLKTTGIQNLSNLGVTDKKARKICALVFMVLTNKEASFPNFCVKTKDPE